MKRVLFVLALFALAMFGVLAVSSADMSPAPTVVTPDSLKWTPIQGLAGAELAVVLGDPTKPGQYIERIRVADGVTFPPHWHPQDERVTVLSGTLMFGVGDKVDMSQTKALGPQSFVFIPHGVHHYGVTRGATLLQVSGMGPDIMNVVK